MNFQKRCKQSAKRKDNKQYAIIAAGRLALDISKQEQHIPVIPAVRVLAAAVTVVTVVGTDVAADVAEVTATTETDETAAVAVVGDVAATVDAGTVALLAVVETDA